MGTVDRRTFLKGMGGLAATAGGMSILDACGAGSSGGSGSSGGGQSESGAQLTMWLMDTIRSKPVGEMVAAFTRETGIQVTVQTVPWAQAFTKWATTFQAGNAPDVSETASTWASYYLDKGSCWT